MKKILLLSFTIWIAIATTAQSSSFYNNPILSGFYPDPSICRVGNDYYLVNSTFAYYPGLPVFHSRDLVNWELIGHVIEKQKQVDFTGKGVSRGLFAPTIRYHQGLFYVTCTLVDGKGNFVVTAKNPAGPWSEPVWLPINGIDPSLFFNDDGKCYITYNSIPPDDISLYDGHRTIRINEFDYKNGKVIGENKILVNGGTDITKKPSWIEGPHIVKKDGYYYLISAEGGTGEGHSVVAFRSRNIFGSYESFKGNPILTQRNLQAHRKHPITSTGHADFVQLPDGRWYTVFLGTRPYEENYFNTGRETFLTPVEWKDGWPMVNPGKEEVQYQYPLPLKSKGGKIKTNTGNFWWKEEFKSGSLNKDWVSLRKPVQYSISKGFLKLDIKPETVAGKTSPSYIGRRQQHTNFTASTVVLFNAESAKEKAGLLCYMNEDHFYFLAKGKLNDKPVVQLYQSSRNVADSNTMILLESEEVKAGVPIQLKAQGKGSVYSFSYSMDGKTWRLLRDNVDGKFLSTRVAGGFGANFVGCTIGMYATSLGNASTNAAHFDWFQYQGHDEVFR